MAGITVKVENGKVYQSLRRVGENVPRITDRQIKAMMTASRDEVRTYPPPLPHQRYQRTGKRYRATVVQKIGTRAYRLESNPVYRRGQTGNPYVIGDAFGNGQAQIHMGRWKVLFEVVSRNVKKLIRDAQFELSQFLRGEGIGL